jgi:hypothetical protein
MPHESQLAPVCRPDVHAVRRAHPNPTAPIYREAIGIPMVSVAKEPPIGGVLIAANGGLSRHQQARYAI